MLPAADRRAESSDLEVPIGQLQLTRFVNPAGLRSDDGIHFRATESAGNTISDDPGWSGMGLIRQGFVERANVQIPGVELRLARLRRQLAGLLAQIEPALVAATERLYDAELEATR